MSNHRAPPKRGFIRAAGKRLPDYRIANRFKGVFYIGASVAGPHVSAWPRKRPGPGTPAQRAARDAFKRYTQAVADTLDADKVGARLLAHGTTDTWRDVLSRMVGGTLIEIDNLGIIDVKTFLDQLGTVKGSIIICGDDGWQVLVPPTADKVLAFDVASHLPVWEDAPATGIDQLHGDVLAGPGSGNVSAALSATGVAAGTYVAATITVDAKGRLSAASASGIVGGITQLTGDVTAGPGSGSRPATLANTAVTPGTYNPASITVDAKGRVTAAANGSVGITSAAVGSAKLAADVVFSSTPVTVTAVTGLLVPVGPYTVGKTLYVFSTIWVNPNHLGFVITLDGIQQQTQGSSIAADPNGYSAQTVAGLPVAVPGDNAVHNIEIKIFAVATTAGSTVKQTSFITVMQ